jgi:hypothetical protein
MLEKTSTSVKFLAFYTASKQGSSGLTVTVDVYDPSGTKIVDASAATELAGGLYTYTLSSSNSSAGEYVAIFKTADANVDAQHVPSLWSLGRAGVENLDASVSSRLADADYTAPTAAPTVADIRTELDANSTKLANLDATISSRSTLTAEQVNAEADTALADVGLTSTITDRLANVATTNIVGTLLAQAHS